MNIKGKAILTTVLISAFLTSAVAMTVTAADGTGGRSPSDASVGVLLPEAAEKDEAEKSAVKHTDALSHGLLILKKQHKLKKTCTDGEVAFGRGDFAGFANGREVGSVTVLSLPELSEGTLKLGALDVFAGQTIYAQSLDRLKFVPSRKGAEASFTFSVNGRDDVCECIVYANTGKNAAPEADPKTVYTKQNVTLYSSLDATDPDGDDIFCFVISQPSHGLLKVDGADFAYTPDRNHIGKDSFVCGFEDKYGNRSEPVTVVVKTERNKCGFVYSDMKNSKAEYAAYLLAENDILVGETVAETVSFGPDKKVSRADFIVMAMKAAGYSPNVYSPLRDGFEGAEALSDIQRGYVVTAVSANVIDKNAAALPSGAITEKEAAEIVSALGGSVKPAVSDNGDRPLSRENAAVMLALLIDGRR